jgi:hypothetical protein
VQEELYKYYNIIIGGGGPRSRSQKQGVCADWWWKIRHVDYPCRHGVSIVLARGAGSCDVGVRGCHSDLLLWPRSSRDETGGGRRCALLWKGFLSCALVKQVGVWPQW